MPAALGARRLEFGSASLIEGHQLGVDDDVIGADRRDRAHEGWDAAADVVATPRKQAQRRCRLSELNAPAVEFDLVPPLRADRRCGAQRGGGWLNAPGDRAQDGLGKAGLYTTVTITIAADGELVASLSAAGGNEFAARYAPWDTERVRPAWA